MASTGAHCPPLLIKIYPCWDVQAWTNQLASSPSLSLSSMVTGHLIQTLALPQHLHQSSPLLTALIQGEKNNMADIALCSFHDASFLQNNFLTIFSHKFPSPQDTCWKEFQLPERWSSCVTSCLHGTALPMT